MELPDAPFYRRWSVLLAGIIGLAAIVGLVGWRGFQQVATPSTTTTTPPTTVAPTTTAPPTSLESTSKRAPGVWRIEWEFDCSNFKDLGTGGFKITGSGGLTGVDIQETTLEGSGRKTFTRGGFGRLLVESVCDSWSVRVLAT
jgi:hypothetical protein